MAVTIRPATLKDAEKIFAFIGANREQLVPRSLGNVVENIDRFRIAEEAGEMLGCAAYTVHPEIGEAEAAAVEIVSVAVREKRRRQGVGRALVERLVQDVRSFGPREVVALTFTPEFFGKLGFVEILKTEIMHKLYTGCINCTKHANPYTCPEIAMRKVI